MKKLFVLFLLVIFVSPAQAQTTRYLVKLKNKGSNPFTLSNPAAYLSQRAIDRRIRYGIALDSTDLPVTPDYILQIKNIPNVLVLNVSKWLNSITIQTSDVGAITAINNLPFVVNTTAIASRETAGSPRNKLDIELVPIIPTSERTSEIMEDYFNYGASAYNEIHLHKGEFLHNIGLRGQNMHITIQDAGFFQYTTLRAFDSVNLNGQVLSTWDFVARNESVVEDNAHGMHCFSTIAANIPGEFVGKAPKAGFHLFRTEDVVSEYPVEEHNWVAAAEKADSLGTDLISSSLGYTTFDLPGFDYPYSERDGNTAMISVGADLAAKKGILVFNSVGNIIDASTEFLSVPADGDSVVAVGSVNSSGMVTLNSSYGPSADGQVKPDVASVGAGVVVQAIDNSISTGNGTSFACPNMAGLTACLWQGFPEFNNMEILDAVRRASNNFSSPDNRTGYGIPDMKAAFQTLLAAFASSSAILSGCDATINWTSKDVSAMKYEIERKLPGESGYSKVGEVNPLSGNILAVNTYQFNNTIISPTSGTVFYRIRQIIDTSSTTFASVYIDTAEISLAAGCYPTGTNNPEPGNETVVIRPNPAGTTTTMVIESPLAMPAINIFIYNGSGSLVLQLNRSKGPGKASIQIPVGNLTPGKYYITVFDKQRLVGKIEMIRL